MSAQDTKTTPAEPVTYTLDGAPPARWEMITPSQAHEALQHMRKNRRIRQGRVDAIARNIQRGRWRMNGDTIKEGTDGLWDDGQHRFTAIVQAGIAVPMLVVREVDHSARGTIDSGASRTYQDRLRMSGEEGSQVVGSIVKRMYRWDVLRDYSSTSRSYFISDDELESYRLEHVAEIERALEVSKYARQCWLTPTYLGAISIILNRLSENDAADFLKGLIEGAEMKYDNPIMALRRRLKLEADSEQRNYETRMALVFIAWRQWRERKSASTINLPRGRLITNRNYPLPY